MYTNGKHALWLPRNSIEALLALILTVAAVVGVFKAVPVEGLALLFAGAGTAWGFYFGERAGESHPQE